MDLAAETTSGAAKGLITYGRYCANCHGADANTPLLPEYPKLAGQNAAYALQQMKDIKSGARDNGNTAAMKGVMHLSNDAELEAIANWLASLAP